MEVAGVISTLIDYRDSILENLNYQPVGTDTTGHTEVAHSKPGANQVFSETLFTVFWTNRNFTSLNRQGTDKGTHCSIIFFHTPKQDSIGFILLYEQYGEI